MTTAQLFYQTLYDLTLKGGIKFGDFCNKFKAEHPNISDSEIREIALDVLEDIQNNYREEVEDDDED